MSYTSHTSPPARNRTTSLKGRPESPRATTPSVLCASDENFEIWLSTFRPRIEQVDEACHFWPALGTFDITIINERLAMPRDLQYRKHYNAMLPFLNLQTIADAEQSQDDWEICANATAIYSTYETFANFSGTNEVNMRRAVDTLLAIVYPAHVDTFSCSETSFPLPDVPLFTRQLCKLSEECTAKADASVSSTVTLDFSDLTQEEVNRCWFDVNWKIFTAKRLSMGTITVPRLIWEYETTQPNAVHNQVILDAITALLHRRHIGLSALPIRLFSIQPFGAVCYEGYWDDNVPVIRKYTDFSKISTFRDWLSFYLALVRMRTTIEKENIAPIPVAKVGKHPWKNANSTSEENVPPGQPPVVDEDDANSETNVDDMQEALSSSSPSDSNSYQEAFTLDDSPQMVRDGPQSTKTAARSPSNRQPALTSPIPTRPKGHFLELLNHDGLTE